MESTKPTKFAPSPAEAARQIFRESPYPAIRELQCSFRDGVLFIAGRVPNFYLKQLAQIALAHLEGVKRVSNLVEVTE
jgi:BON domain